METKENLIESVRKWVKLDNEIKNIQKEVSRRKKEKKEVSQSLMEIMKSNEIDCFDLKDGQLCYSSKNVKKPLTKKSLLSILSKYYDGNELQATEMNDFILNNREVTIQESITRKFS
jgi:hypothetical protein